MTRLHTAGFESGIPGASPYGGERNGGVENRPVGTVTYQTTVARNGGRALSCAAGGSNYEQVTGLTHTAGVPMYARFYFRFTAAPSEILQVWAWRMNGTVVASLDLLTTRALRLNVPASGSAGNSSVLSVDTWYLIETAITIPAAGNGSVELRIDGVTEVGPSAGNVGTTLTTTTHRIGHVTGTETACTVYADDLAINDGNGADNNSWPGRGAVSFLPAASDAAIGTGWVGGAGGTSGLAAAVDNVPPVGVAVASATDASQIKNAANLGAASDYRANCATPGSVLPSTASIKLSQACMRASCDSTTGTNNMELQGINPADTAVTCNVEQTAVAGTEPTGWKSFRTAYTVDPALGLSDVPVVEATKILTGSTRAHTVDQLGLLVEWVEAVSKAITLSGGGAASAAATAARSATASQSGGGTLTATVTQARAGAATLTGGGLVTAAGAAGGAGAVAVSAGGGVAVAVAPGRAVSASLTGGGAVTGAQAIARAGSASLSGGGTLAATGEAESGQPGETHDGSASLTGGGAVAVTALAGRRTACVSTAKISSQAAGTAGRRGPATVGGGGALTASCSTARYGVATLAGGGGGLAIGEGHPYDFGHTGTLAPVNHRGTAAPGRGRPGRGQPGRFSSGRRR